MTGIATAYFDLLTYPLITLGIPLIAYWGLDCHEHLNPTTNWGQIIKNTFFYTVSWGIGYVGMWASKWIIASIFTEENIIQNAFMQIKERSGFSQEYSYFETLRLNLKYCNIQVYLFAIIFLAIFIIVLGIKKYVILDKKRIAYTCILLFISMYPFIWYYFTQNHSSIHHWFTYRELAISVLGILMIGAINIKIGTDNKSNR